MHNVSKGATGWNDGDFELLLCVLFHRGTCPFLDVNILADNFGHFLANLGAERTRDLASTNAISARFRWGNVCAFRDNLIASHCPKASSQHLLATSWR